MKQRSRHKWNEIQMIVNNIWCVFRETQIWLTSLVDQLRRTKWWDKYQPTQSLNNEVVHQPGTSIFKQRIGRRKLASDKKYGSHNHHYMTQIVRNKSQLTRKIVSGKRTVWQTQDGLGESECTSMWECVCVCERAGSPWDQEGSWSGREEADGRITREKTCCTIH